MKPTGEGTRLSTRAVSVYVLMLVGTVALFMLIAAWGKSFEAPPGSSPHESARSAITAKPDALPHVLVALAAIVIAGRILGALFRHLGQPPVIGEVVAGIMLGPSCLGQIWPDAMAFVLPTSVAPFLGVIAQLGIILYMFLVGLELDAGIIRARAAATVAISHSSMVTPFVMGSGLALILYPRLSSGDVSFTSFALFLGVSLSVTAFPVLARILTDRQMQHTPLGSLALAAAATDDVSAWCLLAFVVGIAQANVSAAVVTLVLTVVYIAVMFLLVRPLAKRYLARLEEAQLTPGVIGIVFAALLLSAVATEFIGIHAIFGAFLFGAVIPHDCALARVMKHKLAELVTVLFLPAFFAFTGMRTQIGLVSGAESWFLCGLIIMTATAGKFGGTLIAARLTGLDWRNATALGILMNTRGLMELIVLNIGFDMKIISPTLFAMMVLMALTTTLATTPLLQWLDLQDQPVALPQEL